MTVLVAYATKHGSTEGIAEAIGRRLRERGLDAEVRPVREVTDLGPYETVVLGSAVYLGAWLKEAQAFLDTHEEPLRRRSLWLFSSGPTAPDQGMDVAVSATLRERLDTLGARDHHLFRGALDRKRLGLLERAAIRAAKQPLGDFRDWADIEAWADRVAAAAGALA